MTLQEFISIIGVVGIFIISEIIFYSDTKKYIKVLACVIILLDIAIWLMYLCRSKIPDAMDVYRGKTELKIENKYINDELVKSDTIVVYKKCVK